MADLSNPGVGAAAAHPPWRPAPVRAALAEGEVHVWRADLEAPAERLVELLCAQELARAARFRDPRAGTCWARAHGILRALLGRYLERDPRELRFSVGEHGKPALAAELPRCCFNLSHSGKLALFAFSAATAVGIDVEVARRERDLPALAASVFSAEQARRLQKLPAAQREQEFLRLWVRHEAQLKCDGSGLGGGAGPAADDRWLCELDAGPRAAAAVAAEHPPSVLCCWSVGEPADTLLVSR
jgi:4'-phosphopantetheinyl transferase